MNTTSTSSNRAAVFVCTSCEERHKKLFLAINLASQQKTTKLYFSSQVRGRFKLSVSHYAVVCEVINLWIAMFKKKKTGGGGHSHMKGAEMLVVSLWCVNFRFWSRLGCSGQNIIIFGRKGLLAFRVALEKIFKKIIYFQFVLFTLFL